MKKKVKAIKKPSVQSVQNPSTPPAAMTGFKKGGKTSMKKKC